MNESERIKQEFLDRVELVAINNPEFIKEAIAEILKSDSEPALGPYKFGH